MSFCNIITDSKGKAGAAGFDTVLRIVKFNCSVFIKNSCIDQKSRAYGCHAQRNQKFFSGREIFFIQKRIAERHAQESYQERYNYILRSMTAQIHTGKAYKQNKKRAQKPGGLFSCIQSQCSQKSRDALCVTAWKRVSGCAGHCGGNRFKGRIQKPGTGNAKSYF